MTRLQIPDPVQLPASKHAIEYRIRGAHPSPAFAHRDLPDDVQHGPLTRRILIAREEQRSVGALQVRAALVIVVA